MAERTEAGHRVPADETSASAKTKAAVSYAADELEFFFAVEVTYHRSRRDFLMAAHRWAVAAAILFGASAAADLLRLAAGLIAAAAGTADIAFDFVGRSQSHADAMRRYLDMAGRLSRVRDQEGCDDLTREWIAGSADEPALYPAVRATAHNDTIVSLGRANDSIPLTRWQRLAAQFWPFQVQAEEPHSDTT